MGFNFYQNNFPRNILHEYGLQILRSTTAHRNLILSEKIRQFSYWLEDPFGPAVRKISAGTSCKILTDSCLPSRAVKERGWGRERVRGKEREREIESKGGGRRGADRNGKNKLKHKRHTAKHTNTHFHIRYAPHTNSIFKYQITYYTPKL